MTAHAVLTRQPGKPWTFDDAAKHLGVHLRTLERAERAGKLRVSRIGRRKFLPDSEVRRLADTGLDAPTTPLVTELLEQVIALAAHRNMAVTTADRLATRSGEEVARG